MTKCDYCGEERQYTKREYDGAGNFIIICSDCEEINPKI